MLKFIIYQADLFKTPFHLRNKGYEKTSTTVGLLISIGIISFIAINFFNSDIFYHKRPNTSDQSIQLIKKENINLNKENFGFTFSLTDETGNTFKDDSIFSFTLFQATVDSLTKNFTEIYLKETHTCNLSDFKNENDLYNYGFENYSCFNNDSLNLNGGYNEKNISYFGMMLMACNNYTSNNTCKSEEEIFNFLSNKYVNIFFRESIYDLNNYEKPINSIYKNLYWTISSKMKKTAYIYIKKLEILTDDGFLFENSNLQQGLKTDNVEVDFDLNYNTFLFGSFFYSSPKKQYALRNYQKIQEVMAGMGGIFSFFFSVGFIFTYHQNYLNRINIIMNQLYTFPKINSIKNNNKSPLLKLKQNIIKKSKIRPIEKKKKKKNGDKSNNISSPIEKKSKKLNFKNKSEKDIIKSPEETVIGNFEFKNQSKFSLTSSDDDYIEKISQKFQNSNTPSENLLDSEQIRKNTNINIHQTNNLSAFSKMINKTKNEKKIINLQKEMSKNEKFNFSIIDFVILKIKKILKIKSSSKELLFLKTEKTFLKEIDLVLLLKRIHEINKIKLLLFNERQLSLLSLLSKPMIFIKNEEIQKPNSQFNISRPSVRLANILKDSDRKICNDNLFENYMETLNSIKNNEIDKKLIRFLDEKATVLINNKNL